MQKIGRGLGKLISELGLEDAVRENAVRENWEEVLGDALSGHLRPGPVRASVLYIYADSPVWLQQASYYRTEILKRLAPLGIKELKLQGKGSAGKKPAMKPSSKKEFPPLSAEELILIERALSPLQDDELRGLSRRILEKAFRSGKKPENT